MTQINDAAATARTTTMRTRTKRLPLVNWRVAALPWLFLAPALFIYAVFLVGPMLFTLYTSFFRWDGLSPLSNMVFVGLDNYVRILFQDEVSQRAFVNNLIWTAGAVIIPTAIGLILAVALNSVSAVNKTLRTKSICTC